ncbi:MAG: hypothetical protein JWM68_2355 [Verrucomicrobiales bacterium]|nr:hypothetical protein [Verrucomicrobiales bacterium]
MIFSVITPSFNCKDYILENIESVRRQGFGSDDLEHWIIDGGSTDGTIELLKRQNGIKWISEPDNGLSDAVNKGIQRAKGEWIIWLNADDVLSSDACKIFLDYARKYPDVRIFAGEQNILRYDGSLERVSPAWDYNLRELLGLRTGINQASTFVHREAYEKIGVLDVSNRYTMDYEWLIRAMHRYNCVPIPQVLASYRRRRGSITDAGLVYQFKDFLRIRRQYKKSYFSAAELRIRFYLYTDWLRRIRWIRRSIRGMKTLLGKKPLHPM